MKYNEFKLRCHRDTKAATYTCTMPISSFIALPQHLQIPAVKRAQRWWHHLAPHRQDWVAMLAPLAAVADSIPEMEWRETEHKARALLRASELVEEGLE